MPTERTPVAKGTAGFCQPGYMFINQASATPNSLTQARLARSCGLRHQRFYFADLDAGELWANPPAGVVAFALQVLSNTVNVASVSMNANRQMLVAGASTNTNGYVHTWSRGSKTRATGTDVPPVAKGTAGFVASDGAMLIADQDAGASDPLSTGRFTSTNHGALRHHVLYFTGVDATDSDTWTPSARLVPKIVDYAWQPITGTSTADAAQVVFSTTVMTFFGPATGCDGWLHLWLR